MTFNLNLKNSFILGLMLFLVVIALDATLASTLAYFFPLKFKLIYELLPVFLGSLSIGFAYAYYFKEKLTNTKLFKIILSFGFWSLFLVLIISLTVKIMFPNFTPKFMLIAELAHLKDLFAFFLGFVVAFSSLSIGNRLYFAIKSEK